MDDKVGNDFYSVYACSCGRKEGFERKPECRRHQKHVAAELQLTEGPPVVWLFYMIRRSRQ